MTSEDPRKFAETKFKQPDNKIELVSSAPVSNTPFNLIPSIPSDPEIFDGNHHVDPSELEQLIQTNCDSAPDLNSILSTIRESLLGFSKSNVDTNRKTHLNSDPVSKFGGEALLHFGSVAIIFVILLIAGIGILAPHQGLSASRAFNLLIVAIPVITLFGHSYTNQFAGYTALMGKHKFAEFFYNLSNGIFRNSLYITIREFADTAEGAGADYYMRTGRFRKAYAHLNHLLKVTATPGKDLKALAKLTLLSTMKASVSAELGRTAEAKLWIEESLNWFERTSSIDESDRKLIASESLFNLASALRTIGAPRPSLTCYTQSMAEATGEGRSTVVLLRTILGAGQACLDLGDLEGASDCFHLLEDVVATYRNVEAETILQLRIAEAQLQLAQGKLLEAEETLAAEGERLAHQGDGLRSGQFYTTRAEVYNQTGRLSDAIADLDQALRIFRHCVPVTSPHFKRHLHLYDECLKQLAVTQPDLAHEKRSKCIELLQVNEVEIEPNVEAPEDSAMRTLKGSKNLGSYHIGIRQKLVFGGLIILGSIAPILGGIRAADIFDWTWFAIALVIACLLAHTVWTPKIRQLLLANKFKNCELQNANVLFKRVEQSEWTNAQVFTAHLGSPFNQELAVSDHMDILSGKIFKYAKAKTYSIVTANGAPIAVSTDDGFIPLAKAETSLHEVVSKTKLQRRLYSWTVGIAFFGTLIGFFYTGMIQLSAENFHSKLPSNLTAYEYYRYGAKILSASGDLAHPERLKVGEQALLQSQKIDGDGVIGKAAARYRQSHVLNHVPEESILKAYETASEKFESDSTKSVAAMEELIKQDPQFLLPYISLADYYTQKHQLTDALKMLTAAEAINNKDSRYLIARARYEAALGHPEAVKEISKQLLESNPLDPRDAAQVLFF